MAKVLWRNPPSVVPLTLTPSSFEVGLRGGALTTIDFGSAQLARYVYLKLQGSSPDHWWSVHELNVFQ